ncbi:MAG: hypothetical protein ACHQSE_13220, partial [Gemmatimonadales bacterium]
AGSSPTRAHWAARAFPVDSVGPARGPAARRGPGVLTAYTPRTLAAAPPGDINAMRWRHAIPKETQWLFCTVLKPGFVWSSGKLSAEHGTMSDESVNVPIAFWGAGVVPHLFAEQARTVDIAPTLAAFLNVRPSEAIDGKVIPGVFGRGEAVKARDP